TITYLSDIGCLEIQGASLFIETFMTFLLALTLLEISPGPDMMLTIATRSGRSDDWGSPVISSRFLTSEIHSFMPRF
ncbi:hypothetical protein QIG72_01900, partial [Klebsiella pneumoniae]|nr:hypothetical protein [Klebsiella pneumoniae]